MRADGLLRPDEYFFLPNIIGKLHIFRLLIDIGGAVRFFEKAERLCPAEHREGLMYLRRKAGILTRDEIGEAVKGLVDIARLGKPDAHLSPFALAYPFVEDFLRPGEIVDRFRTIALQEDVHVMFVLRISGIDDDIPLIARVMSEGIGKQQDIPFQKLKNGFYAPKNGQWNIREEKKGGQV
jgi:hypothetical protein